jgi:Icc-related predicted phosphoesterase
MKIVCISDQHGNLPVIPPCDLLLIAGDICPTVDHSVNRQEAWITTQFRQWLKDVDARQKVFIAGNHDFFFEKAKKSVIEHVLNNFPGTYLQDSSIEFEGLKIYGTPWQPYFYDWAFNLYEEDLSKKWNQIPSDADIIVVHGPPMGYGDWAPRTNGKGGENTGSPSLLVKIEEVKPKLVVFGHIHEGRGNWDLNGTKLVNATLLNRQYEMVYEPYVLEI